MLSKHKHPSLEGGLLIILVVVSIISIGYYSEGNVGIAQITGKMVKVSGMEIYSNFQAAEKPGNVGKTATIGDTEYDVTKYQNTYVFFKKDKLNGRDSSGYQYFTRTSTQDAPLPAPPPTSSSPQTAPPPPPGAPQPPTAPTPPPAPAPNPENVPIGEVKLANDNKYYYKWPDGRLQVYEGTTWKDITYTYSLTVKDSAGTTQVIRVEAPTLANAQNYRMPAGTTVTNAVKVTDLSVTPTGTFTTTTIMDKDAVTNGQVTYFVPEGKTPTVYATELSDKARINDAYTQWRTGQNLADTPENRKLFRDYSPSGINTELIDATLGLKSTEEGKKETLPYTSIKLPNNQYMLKYDINEDGTIQDNEMFVQDSPEPTGTLQNLIDFKGKHTTAVLQKNYMSDGNRVYLKNGVYISEATGQPILSMTETRDIGITKATIYYTLKDGTAKKIDHVEIKGIDATQMDLDTFNKIKSSIQSGTAPSGSNGKITYTDKDGRTIEVDISTYKDEVNGVKDGIWEGTRAITTSSYVYLDTQGNQISKEQHDKLTEEGETLPDRIEVEITEKEEFKKGEVIVKSNIFGEDETKQGQVLKTYYWERLIIRDGSIRIEGAKIDPNTNELLEFTLRVYDEDGNAKSITLNKDGSKKEGDDELLSEAQTRQSQFKSYQWFADFEFKLSQYKGLAGWSQLIWSDEELAPWREGVDKLFSALYLGTDYWNSKICSRYIPKDLQGMFTMKTKDGLFDIVAHVEGEKSLTQNPNGTIQYLYKLTFSVRNPKYSRYDKLRFNVYLYGDRTVQLYTQDIEVEDGKSFTRGAGIRENGELRYDEEHGKPIVRYSYFNYNRICIKFGQGIINAKGRIEEEVCNAIVQYKGSATEYEKKVVGVTAEGTPITAEKPTEPYQEADF